MTASSIFSLILGLLKFVNFLTGYLHDRKMFLEGQQDQINKSLVEIARRSDLIKAAAKKVEGMSDEQVFAELDKSHGLRD